MQTQQAWIESTELHDFSLRVTCIAAPYQMEGMYMGHTLYFRSRHGRSRVDVDGYDTWHYEREIDIAYPRQALQFILDALEEYEGEQV